MDTKLLHFRRNISHFGWMTVGVGAFFVGVGLAFLLWTRSPRIVRGVFVAGVPVSGLTRDQAAAKVAAALPPLEPHTVKVEYQDRQWATSSAGLGLHYNIDAAISDALIQGRQSSVVAQQSVERAQLLASPKDLPVPLAFEDAPVNDWVEQIARDIYQEGRQPNARLTNSGYTIDSGELGQRLLGETLAEDLRTHAGQTTPFDAPVKITVTPLSADGRIVAEKRLETLRPAQLVLVASEEEPKIFIDATEFFPWLSLPTGWQIEKIDAYIDGLSEKLNRPPVNAEFERGEGKKLKKFQPHRMGREIERDQLLLAITNAFTDIERGTVEEKVTIPLPFRTIEPQVKLEDLNSLGIKERLGIGTSTFFHSIPNRVFNVDLTAKKLNATLVAPGEEFSFGQAVGEISRATGFKPAYVISGGRTVLGDGGGVCQASTTTFRAALNAGFPVTKWKAHSYRVGYYEQNSQPGFDATVYPPAVDLKFRNDTGHYIAIAAIADTENMHLAVEIWGTSDGRTAEISDYKLSNQTGAPAPAYIPDPTLPKGTTRQVDWSAPGATTSFKYTVKDRGGNLLHEKEFVSRFQAWRAVYLVGTQ